MASPPVCEALTICVGVITSDPGSLRALLLDLSVIAAGDRVEHLVVVVLNNGAPADAIASVGEATMHSRFRVVVVSEEQQRVDVSRGIFGSSYRERPAGRLGIAPARTMLQRYVGALMAKTPGAIGWLLDDDMRIDARASWYLSWLPTFRANGIDVLIGGIEGASPNPPLHGMQGQLFDVVHNMKWLRGLDPSTRLPDRTAENDALRQKFPDYYYDLSRRHAEHLEQPHWVEPVGNETVAHAYDRLLAGATGILVGAPLTRPLVVPMPAHPVAAARESVNRGGHTFVLNHRALTDTPNPRLYVEQTETRRSDMFWAIINRYYRGMSIKAVAFPAIHVGRVVGQPTLDLEKVAAEIAGAAIYAGLTAFLEDQPEHRLSFSADEAAWIAQSAARYRQQRLGALARSIGRIGELREKLRVMARPGELDELLRVLDLWFTPAICDRVYAATSVFTSQNVEAFLGSLRQTADDYASAPHPDVDTLQAVLHGGVT